MGDETRNRYILLILSLLLTTHLGWAGWVSVKSVETHADVQVVTAQALNLAAVQSRLIDAVNENANKIQELEIKMAKHNTVEGVRWRIE